MNDGTQLYQSSFLKNQPVSSARSSGRVHLLHIPTNFLYRLITEPWDFVMEIVGIGNTGVGFSNKILSLDAHQTQ